VRPAEDPDGGQVIWAWPEMAFGFLYDIEALGTRLGHRWRADQPQADWKIVHFFGYDNSFYHSILYPALYKAAFPDWNPDIDYNVNEFYLLDGGKFSTSRRHAIWGKEILGPDSVDAIRCYLARTRPEAARTNFELDAYEKYVKTTLRDRWQRWLADLGDRVATRFGSQAPDAGIWTPEHTAFLARLSTRLTAVTRALSPDEFSLNHAVRELEGLVEDAIAFARTEEATARVDGWYNESRTAIALELAAARLLARCAAPIMPRFAGRLAAALGDQKPLQWPRTVELVPAETHIGLASEVFFAASPDRKPVPAA
jgi:methionyl-tRNA synthetase